MFFLTSFLNKNEKFAVKIAFTYIKLTTSESDDDNSFFYIGF